MQVLRLRGRPSDSYLLVRQRPEDLGGASLNPVGSGGGWLLVCDQWFVKPLGYTWASCHRTVRRRIANSLRYSRWRAVDGSGQRGSGSPQSLVGCGTRVPVLWVPPPNGKWAGPTAAAGDIYIYCPEREIVSNLRLERVSHSNKKNHSGPRAKTHHIQVDLLAMFLAVAICAINFIHLARSW